MFKFWKKNIFKTFFRLYSGSHQTLGTFLCQRNYYNSGFNRWMADPLDCRGAISRVLEFHIALQQVHLPRCLFPFLSFIIIIILMNKMLVYFNG
jgi:hypothetical protein